MEVSSRNPTKRVQQKKVPGQIGARPRSRKSFLAEPGRDTRLGGKPGGGSDVRLERDLVGSVPAKPIHPKCFPKVENSSSKKLGKKEDVKTKGWRGGGQVVEKTGRTHAVSRPRDQAIWEEWNAWLG